MRTMPYQLLFHREPVFGGNR